MKGDSRLAVNSILMLRCMLGVEGFDGKTALGIVMADKLESHNGFRKQGLSFSKIWQTVQRHRAYADTDSHLVFIVYIFTHMQTNNYVYAPLVIGDGGDINPQRDLHDCRLNFNHSNLCPTRTTGFTCASEWIQSAQPHIPWEHVFTAALISKLQRHVPYMSSVAEKVICGFA